MKPRRKGGFLSSDQCREASQHATPPAQHCAFFWDLSKGNGPPYPKWAPRGPAGASQAGQPREKVL